MNRFVNDVVRPLARYSLYGLAAALFASSLIFAPNLKATQASCVMPTAGTVTGLTLVNDINACNGSLLSLYSGASAPGSPPTGMLWLNTTTSFIQQWDGSTWLNLWLVDATNHVTTLPIGGGITTAAITAAATTDIGTIPQSFKLVNGTTSITSLGSSATVGTIHVLKFNGILTLTYNATSLILPGGLSITTAVGDIAFALYLGSGNWQILNYVPVSGVAVTNAAVPLGTVLYGDFMTLPPKTVYGSGQAISRSSFPGYTAAVSRTQTMTRTTGNATLASVADTSGMGAGMPVEGPGISVGCTIASLVANTSITLNNSTCVSASGSASITVFGTGYGTGGDSTTVGVKDCRNKVMAGRGDLNGTDAALLTSAVLGANPNAINAAFGTQSRTLTTPNLPPYTPGGTNSVSQTDVANQLGLVKNATGNVGFGGGASGGVTVAISNSNLSVTFTGTPQGGTSTPFNVVQPTAVAQCVVVVSP